MHYLNNAFCAEGYDFTSACLFVSLSVRWITQQESHAVARKPRDAAAVVFGLKFVDNIHYKFKRSQSSKAMLQSSKHTGAKQNLTQNGYSVSLKITYFGVNGKAIRV